MRSSYILGIFVVVCLIAAAIFSGDVSNVKSKSLPGEGGVFGPLVVKKKIPAMKSACKIMSL